MVARSKTNSSVDEMVLVGRKTLSVGLINGGEPVKYGVPLALSGEALEYALTKTYDDGTLERQMFEPASSPAGRRAIAITEGKPIPIEETQPRTRRRAS